MRIMFRFALTAFCALGLSTSASADTRDASSLLESPALMTLANGHLEAAFEKSTAIGDEFLAHLGGPTTMTCTSAVERGGLETCIVTIVGKPGATMPAALAQN